MKVKLRIPESCVPAAKKYNYEILNQDKRGHWWVTIIAGNSREMDERRRDLAERIQPLMPRQADDTDDDDEEDEKKARKRYEAKAKRLGDEIRRVSGGHLDVDLDHIDDRYAELRVAHRWVHDQGEGVNYMGWGDSLYGGPVSVTWLSPTKLLRFLRTLPAWSGPPLTDGSNSREIVEPLAESILEECWTKGEPRRFGDDDD